MLKMSEAAPTDLQAQEPGMRSYGPLSGGRSGGKEWRP